MTSEYLEQSRAWLNEELRGCMGLWDCLSVGWVEGVAHERWMLGKRQGGGVPYVQAHLTHVVGAGEHGDAVISHNFFMGLFCLDSGRGRSTVRREVIFSL